MKINKPADDRAVPFKDVDNDGCFEFDGGLYIKREDSAGFCDAVRLHECGCRLARFASDTQCIPVDVEISYTYKPNAG